ncbi:putative Succinate dehydrogenase assembly factor 2, mitochondrial [Hypsibius exemplaris]|uniref:Succinate dehydrogenase assembly factor 2, mitochondrial n=1 Tax=Hypsibius exemplaris TaxID=2072580 RepID=A0A1W0WMR3_HYPEX|nr:putative Succinate dehydrogenase assembly factor 2, mitochondrial [Hypsibius exemplaris]
MTISGLCLRFASRSCQLYGGKFAGPSWRAFGSSAVRNSSVKSGGPLPTIAQQIDALYAEQPPIPEYRAREGEPTEVKRARLLFQSRKRGMLENGLLLSSFADRFLAELDDKQLDTYDTLINLPTNDWDIYYWISGVRPPPEDFQSDVMTMLQNFVKMKRKNPVFANRI